MRDSAIVGPGSDSEEELELVLGRKGELLVAEIRARPIREKHGYTDAWKDDGRLVYLVVRAAIMGPVDSLAGSPTAPSPSMRGPTTLGSLMLFTTLCARSQ